MSTYEETHRELIETLSQHPNDMEARMQLLRTNLQWAKQLDAATDAPLLDTLANEILHWGPLLIEMPTKGKDVVYVVTRDMAPLLDHNRELKRSMLKLELEVLERVEAETGHDMEITENLRCAISDL